MTASVRTPSAAELEARIEALLHDFPALAEIVPEECSGCQATEIGYRLGWDASAAWEQIESYRWLLGADRDARVATRTIRQLVDEDAV